MRLNQLEYFVKTVECGGANAAARELSVSQSAISAAIRELEEELGVPLFRRVRQQLILTEEGAAFYRRVGPLLIQLQVAVHEVQAMAGGPQALRLCLPPLSLCGDNAAMIGAQAYYEYLAGNTADSSLNAMATMSIDKSFADYAGQ